MVETAGQKLRKARERKKLSIDEVSRATRIRPERVVDLENDEYGNFPNLSYGRNFLLLYARHLGLEPTEVTETYANENMFGLDDYEYLHSDREQPLPAVITDKPHRPLVPLIIGFLAITMVLAIIVGFLVISAKRISSNGDSTGDLQALEESLQEVPPPAATDQVAEPTPPPSPGPVPAPLVEASATPTPAEVKPEVKKEEEEVVTVKRAVPVNAAETPADVQNVVVVQALRDTKVTVHQGSDADAPIVFDNTLSRDAAPLTLRGEGFYIEVEGGGDAVKITNNGEVLPYSGPALIVQ